MYSRAARLGENLGSTSLHVGPGTYDVVTFDNKKNSLGKIKTNLFQFLYYQHEIGSKVNFFDC